MNLIIHPNQSVFIKGRRIADNVLLAHELVKGYCKNKDCCCALKVDLQIAYDSVSWDFIEEIMLAFGFPLNFIKLVMKCIRSCIYSVVINGQIEGYFPVKQGLSQGDPLSSLLFVLCMDYFTRVLNKKSAQGFTFQKKCRELQLFC